MPFRYNLEKILKYRITKRDEQLEIVKQAQMELNRICQEIAQKYQEIAGVQADMKKAPIQQYDMYDKFIKHLYKQLEELEEKKKAAEQKLKEEQDKLTECEQNVKVLEKHKEKKKEEYEKEQKEIEMKQLNETASIKHFRMQREKQEELEMEEYLKGLQEDGY